MLANPPAMRKARTGFSLVELLVVMAVLSLLTALALPSLRRARGSAQQVASLANVRQLGIAFAAYTNTFNDSFPFVPPGTLLPLCDGNSIADSNPWSLRYAWPALGEPLPAFPRDFKALVSPGRRREPRECGWPTSYEYSNSFIASPNLWTSDQSLSADRGLLRGIRSAEVFYPANKVLLWDTELAYLSSERRFSAFDALDPTPMTFAYGHAVVRIPAHAVAAAPNPLKSALELRRLHDTPLGVQGIDYP